MQLLDRYFLNRSEIFLPSLPSVLSNPKYDPATIESAPNELTNRLAVHQHLLSDLEGHGGALPAGRQQLAERGEEPQQQRERPGSGKDEVRQVLLLTPQP